MWDRYDSWKLDNNEATHFECDDCYEYLPVAVLSDKFIDICINCAERADELYDDTELLNEITRS